VAQLGHHQAAPSSIAVHRALHLSLLLISSRLRISSLFFSRQAKIELCVCEGRMKM
jgi:hypothetical protein